MIDSIAVTTRKLTKELAKRSPGILTGCAVIGTVSTAIFAGKATIKARDVITAHDMDEELKCEKYLEIEPGHYDITVYYRERTFFEKAKLTWRVWAPPVLMCGATISCIVGANTISTRRNIALAAAYSMSEEARKEFRDKVTETIGKKKVEKIDHEINQDRINANPLPNYIPTLGYGSVMQLYRDGWSGQYFYSYGSWLDKQEASFDAMIKKSDGSEYFRINDWYEFIGLQTTEFGKFYGWVYNGNPTDDQFKIKWDHCWAPDGEVHCAVVLFDADPLP